jgi:hypothetical protein
MTIKLFKNLKTLIQPKSTYTIIHADPDEETRDPVVELPTSEPGEYTSSVILSSDHFPVIPRSLICDYILHHAICGRNQGGASRTVYFKSFHERLGVITNLANSSGNPSNGYYWTGYHYNRFVGLSPGDIIHYKVWANGAGVSWHWRGLNIIPTRLRFPNKPNKVFIDLLATLVERPVYVGGGNPYSPYTSYNGFRGYNGDIADPSYTVGGTYARKSVQHGPVSGLGRAEAGDAGGQGGAVSSSIMYRPQYGRAFCISTFECRETAIINTP